MIKDLWDQGDFESIVALDHEELNDPKDRTLYKEAQAAVELITLSQRYSSEEITDKGGIRLQSRTKVVTILHSSLPNHIGGYTGRAQGLLKGLQGNGLTVIGYTRPGFIQERVDKRARPPYEDDVVDGVRYRHLSTDFPRKRGEFRYMLDCVSKYLEVFEREQPNVVHVRSTYLIALPALIAAHQLGLPVLYEISGLWELVFQGRGAYGKANRIARMEDATVASADCVVSMNHSMANLLKERNEKSVEIGLVPNAVDATRFSLVPPLDEVETFNYDIGYVGSLVDYEGLDVLLHAIHELKKKGKTVTAKIVGGGKEEKFLRKLAHDLGIDDQVNLAGKVPASQAVYQFNDVKMVCLPRKSTPATECVTPLKPFEAMAAGRPLLVSSVSALSELAQGGRIARVFQEQDPESLAREIEYLLDDADVQRTMVKNAQQTIAEEYSWSLVSERMKNSLLSIAAPAKKLPLLRRQDAGNLISL
ncbi:glycosyltransferase [Corynebacterium sp. 320]|nr:MULTISPECIES: glycosyltransferase family 4 protein [Corynebacterium]KAB1550809.1 glycosyltransferase [Corynebacterium sp. 321]KAB3538525.1 glycosyltransferase [Corynebacterium sp. 366]KAB1503163.1 glycosyltransferase [Corynebacterium sp. 320]KAB1550985.1 glycosyltransferase [Corynebacterium sp. 319]KAB3526960.1 glycosyltransferase [Corynebacterium sp. 250]